MAQLFGLSAEQVARICPLFPRNGCEWVDDRKVFRGIIHVIQKALRCVDAPAADGPPQNPLQPFPPLVRQGCV